MIYVTRKNTARRGDHFAIECDADTFDALIAAIEIAYGDTASVPDEYTEGGNELWRLVEETATMREP